MTATAAAPPGESRITGADGASLRSLWWHAVPPTGAAVLVHGLGEHAGRYDHVARALNASGISVSSFDHRGHGRSDGRRGHARRFDVLLEDLDRVWSDSTEKLGRMPRFLVGHSLGGLVSLAWTATRQPDLAGLVVSAPWLATVAPMPRWKLMAGRIASRIAPGLHMDTGVQPEVLTSDPDVIAAHRSDPLNHTKITPRLYTEVERWQRRIRDGADRLKVPTLWFVPGADGLADASVTRRLAAALPAETTTIVELPGFRHELFNEMGRSEVITRLRSWLEGRLTLEDRRD